MEATPCYIYPKRDPKEPWKLPKWAISIEDVKSFKCPYIPFENGLMLGFYYDITNSFSPFNYNVDEWSYILTLTISQNSNINALYFKQLFMFISYIKHEKFNANSFKSALLNTYKEYPQYKNWITNEIYKCTTLTPIIKQKIIIPILNSLGYSFRIIESPTIIDAYKEIDSFAKKDYNSITMFGHFIFLLNSITNITKQKHPLLQQLTASKNELLQLILWANNIIPTIPTIEIIDKYFYYIPQKFRIRIIQKLFYEHKQGNINLDTNILESIIYSKRKLLYNYQIALNQPPKKSIYLELLLDSLNNYQKNETFLSLNNVLDTAIQNASVNNPNIEIEPASLFKICDGGLRISSRFTGFVQMFPNRNFAQFELDKNAYIQDIKDKEEAQARVVELLNQYAQYNKEQNTWNVPAYNKEAINYLTKILHIRDISKCEHTSNTYLVDYKEINKDMLSKSYVNRKPIGYQDICHPDLSPTPNHILNKGFLWCSGSPCFRSSIYLHNDNWRAYKLIDFLSIMGYDITYQTECGLIGNSAYNKFADTMLKAKRIFDRLKCEKCGHILFPNRKSNNIYANDYTYFCCENESCTEYKQEIYLTHCHSCRTGIIDSRETRKCPNGIYICPSCLACCSNDYFNKIAQRYSLASQTLPTRLKDLLGKGHKEKKIKYCPKCGKEFSFILYKCPNCNQYKN